MPVVFEKLAEQLRDPLFRTSESGYDPEDVGVFLQEVAARLAVLEERVAKAEARAEHAERRLAAARRFASGTDAGVLDDVVFAGQRRAEEVAAEAVVTADRLRAEATAAVAAARASVDDPALRAELDERRASLRTELEACQVRQADVDVVARAVAGARESVLAGLRRDLAELDAMPFLLAKEARP